MPLPAAASLGDIIFGIGRGGAGGFACISISIVVARSSFVMSTFEGQDVLPKGSR